MVKRLVTMFQLTPSNFQYLFTHGQGAGELQAVICIFWPASRCSHDRAHACMHRFNQLWLIDRTYSCCQGRQRTYYPIRLTDVASMPCTEAPNSVSCHVYVRTSGVKQRCLVTQAQRQRPQSKNRATHCPLKRNNTTSHPKPVPCWPRTRSIWAPRHACI